MEADQMSEISGKTVRIYITCRGGERGVQEPNRQTVKTSQLPKSP